MKKELNVSTLGLKSYAEKRKNGTGNPQKREINYIFNVPKGAAKLIGKINSSSSSSC